MYSDKILILLWFHINSLVEVRYYVSSHEATGQIGIELFEPLPLASSGLHKPTPQPHPPNTLSYYKLHSCQNAQNLDS